MNNYLKSLKSNCVKIRGIREIREIREISKVSYNPAFLILVLTFGMYSFSLAGDDSVRIPVACSLSDRVGSKFYTPIEFQGIIPKAFSMEQPLQLINPLAPTSYGYGRGMVSWGAIEAKPKGFIFFGVNLW